VQRGMRSARQPVTPASRAVATAARAARAAATAQQAYHQQQAALTALQHSLQQEQQELHQIQHEAAWLGPQVVHFSLTKLVSHVGAAVGIWPVHQYAWIYMSIVKRSQMQPVHCLGPARVMSRNRALTCACR